MGKAYYNEINLYAAEWLRNLIRAGDIPDGDVDTRSIWEVKPNDLEGYTQCHFFAGIGGWGVALRLAGWPDDRPVWTGSCPCQPFSIAGHGKGDADERHLWPAFQPLIAECRPATVFGEQVAGKLGREWIAAIRVDMEHLGYACGAADLPAASVGAPHVRQRLWWVADSEGQRLANGNGEALAGQAKSKRCSDGCSMGNADGTRRQKREGNCGVQPETRQRAAREAVESPSPWDEFELLHHADGKSRPTQPGLFPLAYGIPQRASKLRAYGNAIVPHVAAVFIQAFTDIQGGDGGHSNRNP